MTKPNLGPTKPRPRPLWRYFVNGVGLILLIVVGFVVFHIASVFWRDWNLPHAAIAPGTIDDASGLNATAVKKIWPIPADPNEAEAQLKKLLTEAHEKHLKVSIAGARHSMGGHTIAPDGIQIDMLSFNKLELDPEKQILHAGAGARWSEIVPYLAERGFAVLIMQSNNDFSVGGSISVNCHGWQPNRPPIASTVRGFRLMLADGSIVHCLRDQNENHELFRLVLGGYGLFGIILEVDLDVVPNELYRGEQWVLPTSDYAKEFDQKVRRAKDAGMAYGRLSPVRSNFGQEAILTVYYTTNSVCHKAAKLGFKEKVLRSLSRAVFRGELRSPFGKWLRWRIEKRAGENAGQPEICRSKIQDAPANLFGNRTFGRTDILQEYFVPVNGLMDFADRLREVVRKYNGRNDPDLLNITVRDVCRDADAFLAYAREDDVFGLVLLFEQATTASAEARAAAETRELIEAVLNVGGTYYLPYRLDADKEQFHRAYPKGKEFFDLKRKYDPEEIFQNKFYQKYGRD